MKYLIYLTFFMFFLSSCSIVYFDQPQPKNGIRLYTVPEELRGAWVEESDTFYIGENGAYVYNYDSITDVFTKDGLPLSDSLLLFKAGEYYVVNFSDDLIWWSIRIIHRHENGDLYFYEPKTEPYFGKHSYLKVDSIDQVFDPVNINETEYRERRVLFKKSLSMRHVMTRNAVYYSGQFRIKDIKKVLIPENEVFIYHYDGRLELRNKKSESME